MRPCACVCVFGVDQVVTDMRLWLRDAIATLTEDALQLISTMVERAAMYDAHWHTRETPDVAL